MLPDDYLIPIWRAKPAHASGVFTVGLDPREAEFVLARGWATLDGIRYRVTDDGCDPNIQGDGRRMVRCDCPAEQPLTLPVNWDVEDSVDADPDAMLGLA